MKIRVDINMDERDQGWESIEINGNFVYNLYHQQNGIISTLVRPAEIASWLKDAYNAGKAGEGFGIETVGRSGEITIEEI